MQNIEISLPPQVQPAEVAQIIDVALAHSGLIVTLRDSLKKYPGCVHWHAKNGRVSGTLEITLWPQERRAWFTVQRGRKALWIEEKLNLISDDLQKQLSDAQ